MNVDRTIKLKLDMSEEDKETLRQTMILSNHVFNEAEAVGKSVVTIDPRYTSQKCSNCGHIYKGNRKGNSFKCVKCGFSLPADLNAARNIAILGRSEDSRLTVNQPYIACDDAVARKGIDAEHSDNALYLSLSAQ